MEVVLVEDLGDFNVVKLTVNNNPTLRNNQILRLFLCHRRNFEIVNEEVH